ncbi:pilus assembly FimT family protein [Thalassotalea sp. PLHSN55]|uniref:pilus assembly FimT family protein n=1 Tax=Thalassotalea sp. PLHSN55 TaxID=3435888 RepID=UPI003F828BB2
MNKQSGFTIIELVSVIILLGILSVAIVPKFSGSSDFEVYTVRAQLISALRLTQQRAMQQTHALASGDTYCHIQRIDAKQYGTNCSGFRTDATALNLADSSVTLSPTDNIISFNSWGIPSCSKGCVITITGDNGDLVQVGIESEGYIHAL